jgi:hypothetical protein
MRYTLTVGLLVCMPTVALLAVAGVAVLAGNLRHRLGDHRHSERGMADAYASGLRFASGPTGISFTTSRFPAANRGCRDAHRIR